MSYLIVSSSLFNTLFSPYIYLLFPAMAQAGSLFDQKNSNGQVSGGGKQDAMQSAGETAMKVSSPNSQLEKLFGMSINSLGIRNFDI